MASWERSQSRAAGAARSRAARGRSAVWRGGVIVWACYAMFNEAAVVGMGGEAVWLSNDGPQGGDLGTV